MSRLICHSIRSNKDGLYIFKIFLKVSHRICGNRLILSTNVDQKSLETGFADCHLSPDFSIACVARLATNGNQNFCKNRMFN